MKKFTGNLFKNLFVSMRQKNVFIIPIAIAFILAALATSVKAEETGNEGWKFTFTPYGWGASLKGSSGIGPVNTNLDLEFTDEILDNLNMGAMGDFRAEKGPWAIRTNILWVELEADAALGPLAMNVELTQWVVELDGRYRVDDHWELVAGGRYYDMNVKASITGARIALAGEVDENWIDPYIGFVFSTPISDRWSFKFGGDIGGFGIGSDFSWQAMALFDYRFGKSNSLIFGWRHLDWDYDDGFGAQRFAMDTYMTGPIIGARFRF